MNTSRKDGGGSLTLKRTAIFMATGLLTLALLGLLFRVFCRKPTESKVMESPSRPHPSIDAVPAETDLPKAAASRRMILAEEVRDGLLKIVGSMVPVDQEFGDSARVGPFDRTAAASDATLLSDLGASTEAFLAGTRVSQEYSGRVLVHSGDIVALGTDAVTNAANEPCLGGGGIDEAIHRAFGCPKPSKLSEGAFYAKVGETLTVTSGSVRCPTGTARPVPVPVPKNPEEAKKWTCSPRTRYVVQAVGPVGRKPHDLFSAYWNTLATAKTLGVRHVSLNCLSTGIFGYPLEEAAHIAVATVRLWMDANKGSDLKVVFVLFPGDQNFEQQKLLYRANIGRLFADTQ